MDTSGFRNWVILEDPTYGRADLLFCPAQEQGLLYVKTELPKLLRVTCSPYKINEGRDISNFSPTLRLHRNKKLVNEMFTCGNLTTKNYRFTSLQMTYQSKNSALGQWALCVKKMQMASTSHHF